MGGSGRWSGPTRPLRLRQVPRRIHTGLPSISPDFLLVELDRLAEADQEGFRAGEAHLGEDLLAGLGVDLGRVQLLEDGLDAHLAVELGLEDLLVIPERDAVADLEHRARRVGQAGDGQLQVDAGGRGLEELALDVELLLEHLDPLDHVGRDRLEPGDLLDRQINQPLGLGRRLLGRFRRGAGHAALGGLRGRRNGLAGGACVPPPGPGREPGHASKACRGSGPGSKRAHRDC